MTMKHLACSILYVSLALSLGACNKKKDKEDGGGDNGSLALTGPAAFIGNWTGIYSPLNGDSKPDGDSHPVKVTFKEDGDFNLVLADVDTATSSGTWSEFGGKSLFLKVQKTSIPRISSDKPVLDMSYDLTGASVDIHNPDFKLKISRVKTAGTDGNGNASPATASGQWTCSANGRVTELSLGTDYHWRATIKSDGSSMLLLAGSGQAVETTRQARQRVEFCIRRNPSTSFDDSTDRRKAVAW